MTEWIEHHGGHCPVPENSWPTVKLRNGESGEHFAFNLIWEHDGRGDDIVAYKPEMSRELEKPE
jgi:hypothetical protein